MAANSTRWLGRAGAVAEVNTITIALTWAAGDTITVVINGKSLVVTIGTLVTTAQVATTLKEAWQGETFTDTTASVVPSGGGAAITEHASFTATVSGSVVTLTCDTAGEPWNITDEWGNDNMPAIADGTAGDGTATLANATAATGPNFVDNADNWTAAQVPGTIIDTTVWIDNSDVSLLYGALATAQDLAGFRVSMTFTGDIGLPKTNASGYPEFRPDYMVVNSPLVSLYGEGTGQGSGRIKIDSEAIATKLVIENTGSPAESGLGALIWKGTSASNELRTMQGSVSVAVFDGETSNLASATINAGTVDFGEAVTWAGGNTIDINTATVILRADTSTAIETVTNSAGQLTVIGTGDAVGATVLVVTLNAEGGTTILKGTGTFTAINVGGPLGALLDCSQDNAARIATTLTLKPNGQLIDPLQTLTPTTLAKSADVSQLLAS